MTVDAATSVSVIGSKKKEYAEFGAQAFASKARASTGHQFAIVPRPVEAPSEHAPDQDAEANISNNDPESKIEKEAPQDPEPEEESEEEEQKQKPKARRGAKAKQAETKKGGK